MGTPLSQHLQSFNFDENTSGDHSIQAAVSGQKIRLRKFWLQAAGAVSIKFRSNTTDLHAEITMAADQLLVFDNADDLPWYETLVSEALQLNLSAAVRVRGTIYYTVGD